MKTKIIIMLSILLISCAMNKEQIQSVTQGMIDVPGGKVWYRIVGADKPGIPLVVLHGGPGAPHDYLETLEVFAEERPVVFYDQLGCGNSEMPSDPSLWTVQRFVDELEQVRTVLQRDKIHILGQSLGTMLAVEYMLQKKPDGVQSLILSGSYLSSPMWIADQQKWISLLPQSVRDTIRKYEENGDFSSPAYQEAVEYFYHEHVCTLDPWPECLNRTMEKFGAEVYGYMIGPSEFTMIGTLKDADITDRMDEITIPVLFTCGEFDEATPETSAYYQSKLPGSELYVFEGASHEHHLEKPDEYSRVVREFMKKAEQ